MRMCVWYESNISLFESIKTCSNSTNKNIVYNRTYLINLFMTPDIHDIRTITDNNAKRGKETIFGEIISYFCRLSIFF